MDLCFHLKGIVAEMFPHILPDAVPEHDVGAEMPMEGGKIRDGKFLGKIIIFTVGMGVSIHEVMSPE
jgi:hypothetical protein